MTTEDLNLWSSLDALLEGTSSRSNLHGIPWQEYSCTLDANIQIAVSIAEVLGDEYCGVEQESMPDIQRLVIEEIISLAKTPARGRKERDLRKIRDHIRELLLTMAGIKIGKESVLEHSDRYIIPSWLVEFPISVDSRCGQCGEEGMIWQANRSGVSFIVRDVRLTRLQSLQDVMDSIVHPSLYLQLKFRSILATKRTQR